MGYRILSLSGGGIRGLILCKILVKLEAMLADRICDKNARIADYFDLICGVSTGGIVTILSLIPESVGYSSTHPKYSAQYILDLYLAEYKNIFTTSWSLWGPKYHSTGIENIGTKYGGIITLSQLCKPSLIVAYDIDKRKPHFFTEKQDFYVKDVMRATCAAPTYFAPAEVRSMSEKVSHFIDGGTVANNPAVCGVFNMLKRGHKDIFVLSISCGQNKDVYPYARAKNWGKLEWIEPLINILIDANMECVDEQLRHLLGENFVQMNPPLIEASEALDDCSDKNIKALLSDSNTYINSKEAQILLNKVLDKIIALE